jgi:hypothetical protein
VDQRIDPTQPDLAPDSSNGDEGVDYLRPLKGAPADAVARGGGKARGFVVRAARSFEPRPATCASGEPLPTSACTDAMWK